MSDEHLSWLAYQPGRYDELLRAKVERVKSTFATALGNGTVEPEIFASPPSHYRQRVRFAVGRFEADGSPSAAGSTSGRLQYALYDKGVCIPRPDTFPVAAESVCRLMPRLLAALEADAILSQSIDCCHFLSSQAGDMLVTLVYGSPLAAGWRPAAVALCEQLCIPALMGRSRGHVETIARNWVTEVYTLADGRRLSYRQVEGSFSNPSSAMAVHTLNFLCSCAMAIAADLKHSRGEPPALLELYCGNGNHTVALAPLFRTVLAVEIDAKLAAAAEGNLASNGVTNAHVLCATSGRFCQALLKKVLEAKAAVGSTGGGDAVGGTAANGGGGRSSKGSGGRGSFDAARSAWLQEAGSRCDVVLVDPPRAGLDESALTTSPTLSPLASASAGSVAEPLEEGSGPTHRLRAAVAGLQHAGRGPRARLFDTCPGGPNRAPSNPLPLARSGTVRLVRSFDHILYVSCNPASLAASLPQLDSHEVLRFAVLDHFPYTRHLEVALYMRRKEGAPAV